MSTDALDQLLAKLQTLDITVQRGLLPSDLEGPDPVSPPPSSDDDKKDSHADVSVIEDPVRMYLKQMGQVPLLTREQEVSISMRIEEAEKNARRLIHHFIRTSPSSPPMWTPATASSSSTPPRSA